MARDAGERGDIGDSSIVEFVGLESWWYGWKVDLSISTGVSMKEYLV